MRLEGEEHLAAIRVKQYELLAHLKGPSNYDDVMAEIEAGHPSRSRSALFMLKLMHASEALLAEDDAA